MIKFLIALKFQTFNQANDAIFILFLKHNFYLLRNLALIGKNKQLLQRVKIKKSCAFESLFLNLGCDFTFVHVVIDDFF